MLKEKTNQQNQQRPLRLWPGVVIVILQWLAWIVLPVIDPDTILISVFGALLGGLFVVVWWAFFSRARRSERWSAVLLMIVALVGTSYLVHVSIGTGMQGLMFYLYAIPTLSLAFVLWAVISQQFPDRIRWTMMVATILLACGVWTLFRSNGITGDIDVDFAWRWAATHEEQLLAQHDDEPMVPPSVTAGADSIAEWPGFRGPNRNSIIRGPRIETNWSVSPPVELWRRPIGPGCSSFAVSKGLIYTQEQRGEEEVVACYNLSTGQPVWRHHDPARFWDSHAGAGPRSTPTLSNGRVYTFGATGILNVLDAYSGTVVWSRNAATDTDAKDSGWGFTSSPLVIGDVVIVAATGKLAAYDIASGEPRWYGPDGGDSYSSPHRVTIDGVEQILLMSAVGATSVAPADGTLLWKCALPAETRIVQPALIEGREVLISAGDRNGMIRFSVRHGSEGWKVEERWKSTRLRPDFNDFVVHKGYAFGFNGPNLMCIDIEDGKRKWKGGRYGGQLILLADQDLLLVLSEQGELVLIEAAPDQFTELARLPGIEGKTWNHPVLVGDILLVRNGREVVAFRLLLARS